MVRTRLADLIARAGDPIYSSISHYQLRLTKSRLSRLINTVVAVARWKRGDSAFLDVTVRDDTHKKAP